VTPPTLQRGYPAVAPGLALQSAKADIVWL
jgi:hypothetical protein